MCSLAKDLWPASLPDFRKVHFWGFQSGLLFVFRLSSLENRTLFFCCCHCHSQRFKDNSQHRLLSCQISSKPLSDPLSLRCNHSQQSFAHMHNVTLKTFYLTHVFPFWNNLPLEAVNCITLSIRLSIIYLSTLFCNL